MKIKINSVVLRLDIIFWLCITGYAAFGHPILYYTFLSYAVMILCFGGLALLISLLTYIPAVKESMQDTKSSGSTMPWYGLFTTTGESLMLAYLVNMPLLAITYIAAAIAVTHFIERVERIRNE